MKPDKFQRVVCLKNDGYLAALEPRNIYRVRPDRQSARQRLLRVVEESGEEYLYPADYLAPLVVPQPVVEALPLAG